MYQEKRFLHSFSDILPTPGTNDQMSDDNNGLINTQTGTYTVDDVKRSRITSGFTFHMRKPYINEIRLNYEQYFFAHDNLNQDNKLVIEFVTKF